MNREFLDHGFAPFLGFDFPADIAAHLPVEIDQGGIDGMKRLLLGAVDKPVSLKYIFLTTWKILILSWRRPHDSNQDGLPSFRKF